MKKILIYRHCSLGDFIVALPAIKMIKDENPNSKIYLSSSRKKEIGFVTPNLIPLKKKIIDEYIFFDHSFFSILKFLKKIKDKKFDKIYYLNHIESKFRLKRDLLIFTILGIK